MDIKQILILIMGIIAYKHFFYTFNLVRSLTANIIYYTYILYYIYVSIHIIGLIIISIDDRFDHCFSITEYWCI